MVVSHLVWLLRTRGIRRRAKEAGKTFDEFDQGVEWQAKGIDVEKLLKSMFTGRRIAAVDDIEAPATSEEVVPKTVPNATG
jgi:hypothetical protein